MQDELAILIPCYNEELTIKDVVEDFQEYAPQAKIYVYDNNSTDKTAEIAKNAGAIVVPSPNQGKGNVVKHMFSTIEATKYVLVDGDSTYFAKDLPAMLDAFDKNDCDMVIGDRLSSSYFAENTRAFHSPGNKLVRFLINHLFHGSIKDVMTGYRVCSKRFCKNMHIKSQGFEIETEMTIYALKNLYKIDSVPITYKDRPDGSESKLSTFKDGYKILKFIFKERFR